MCPHVVVVVAPSRPHNETRERSSAQQPRSLAEKNSFKKITIFFRHNIEKKNRFVNMFSYTHTHARNSDILYLLTNNVE